METYQQVVKIIEDAFREVPLGKIGVLEAEAIDDYAGDGWLKRAYLRRWTNVESEF